jgi:hypothetical protein
VELKPAGEGAAVSSSPQAAPVGKQGHVLCPASSHAQMSFTHLPLEQSLREEHGLPFDRAPPVVESLPPPESPVVVPVVAGALPHARHSVLHPAAATAVAVQ